MYNYPVSSVPLGPTASTRIQQDGRALSHALWNEELPHCHYQDELCHPNQGAKINPSFFKFLLSGGFPQQQQQREQILEAS